MKFTEQNRTGRLRRLTLLTTSLAAAVIVSACAAPAPAPSAQAAAPAATQVATKAPAPTEATPAAPVATVVATGVPAAAPAPTEALAAAPTAAPAPAASTVSFANDVMPVFEKSCIKCHGGSDGTKNGLNLRTYENVMKGGENGAAVVAGDPDNSLLVDLIRKGEMPKRAPDLPREQIDLIAQWVAEGALNN